MKAWNDRPIEIRNLFNPAFCGLVLLRSLAGFEEEDEGGMPFSLSLLILPLCLHRETREVLTKHNRSYFLKVASSQPQLLVDFGRRTNDLLPFTFEALGLLMQLGTLEIHPNGRLRSMLAGVRKSITGTPESIACQRVARFLGREFARVGDRTTIYTHLGIRP